MAAKLPRHAHFRGGKPAGLAHGIPAAHGVNAAQRCGAEFVVRGDGESGEAILPCVRLLWVTAKAADNKNFIHGSGHTFLLKFRTFEFLNVYCRYFAPSSMA